jgi:hypothetical protein
MKRSIQSVMLAVLFVSYGLAGAAVYAPGDPLIQPQRPADSLSLPDLGSREGLDALTRPRPLPRPPNDPGGPHYWQSDPLYIPSPLSRGL